MRLELCDVRIDVAARALFAPLSLTLDAGQGVALMGRNGAGKSTLLRAILGQHAIAAGQIRLDGDDVRRLRPAQWPQRAVWVPQRAEVVWSPPAAAVVGLGFEAQFSPAHLAERRTAAMARLGVAHLAARRFDVLSGGERQLIMLARVLVSSAPLILLDEPWAALDDEAMALVQAALSAEIAMGRSVLMAVHRQADVPPGFVVSALTAPQVV